MPRPFFNVHDAVLLEKVGAGLAAAAPIVLALSFWIDNTSERPQLFSASMLLILVGLLMARIRIDFQ